MAKGASIKLEGVAALKKGLSERANLSDVRNIVALNGSELQKKAIRNAPVDTGNLVRSISLTFPISSGGYVAKISAQAHYALYVELGTRYMSSQPFMGPAFFVQRRIFERDLKRLMK